MATFTTTVNSTNFSVDKQEVISTDCASIFEYVINATNLDEIDITLTGDHSNAYYVLNGVTTTFASSVTGIVFNTSLTLKFILENSSDAGVFDTCDVKIENTTVTGYDTYNDSVIRLNDSPKCGELVVTDYDSLDDTPSSKSGEALKFVRVNAAETLHEYVFITESDISDLGSYLESGDNISELTNDEGFITLTDIPAFDPSDYDLVDFTNLDADPFVRVSDLPSLTELNDLTAAVVWDNVPDINITESSVTQHEAALTITESQISDLNHFTQADLTFDAFTGTVIPLDDLIGHRITTPEYNATYTLGTIVAGGNAVILIDTTGETDFPEITGANLISGSDFEATKIYEMWVYSLDGTNVDYFFIIKGDA